MAAMHHVAERMFNAPLMLELSKAAVIAETFAPRVLGGSVHVAAVEVDAVNVPDMGVLSRRVESRAARWGDDLLTVEHGVAVIEVEGSLAHKGSYIGKSSGVTSYEGICAQVYEAEQANHVKGVAFELDSFGGEVAGAFDCAEAIYELSRAKPTVAILTDHACSAGYLLASACDTIVMPETGIVGSIGVVMMHADFSGMLESEGIKVTLLHDGAHKVDGNPYEPLPEAVAARLQSQLAESRDLFAGTVGKYRGGRLNKGSALATEAQTYHGSEAYDLGLVDAVARPGKAFEAFVEKVNSENLK